MTSNFRKIGDFISVIDNRNTDGSITKLMGISIDKCYIPSVANVIGTNLSNYKVIRRSQFACSLMQVSRDQRIPIAMYEDDVPAIMSPAYVMFEVSRPEELLPEYMELWFKRAEFDREASFYAVGGVRGSLDWEDFCKMELAVPPISEQREIARGYQVITNRIKILKKINEKLETITQSIYQFLCECDSPKTERNNGVVADVLLLQRGHDLPRSEMNGGIYPVAGSIETIGYHDQYTTKAPGIVMGRSGNIGNPRLYLCNCWAHNTTLYVKEYRNSNPFWVFYMLKNLNYDGFKGGSAVPTLNRNDIHAISITIPSIERQNAFANDIIPFLTNIELNKKEIHQLEEIAVLILSNLTCLGSVK